jgi:hypothetical protein
LQLTGQKVKPKACEVHRNWGPRGYLHAWPRLYPCLAFILFYVPFQSQVPLASNLDGNTLTKVGEPFNPPFN